MIKRLRGWLGLYQPEFVLHFRQDDWHAIHQTLRKHSDNVRESGGYLLGTFHDGGTVRVKAFVPYRLLGARGSAELLHIPNARMALLYRHCKRLGCDIVGDIHTHPAGEYQSQTDKDNPMAINLNGPHIALILPEFARHDPNPHRTGIYLFRGKKNGRCHWQTIPQGMRRAHLRVHSNHASDGVITA